MKTLGNPFDFFSLWSESEFLELWRRFARTRIFEEVVSQQYSKKRMRTPTHLGIGQEAIAVGVLHFKKHGDTVFSHHRSHNAYLAAGGDWKRLADELHGLVTGCSKGKGGSVHITDRSVGFVGSSAILGQTITLSTGSAFAHKYKSSSNVSFAFFGDAAMEEGATWESLNFAALYELPVLYVCENNRLSTESHLMNRSKLGTSFQTKVSSFGVSAGGVFGQDIFEVIQQTKIAIDYVRENSKPFFLEMGTYRFLEHVGPFYDFEMNKDFRPKAEQFRDQIFDPKTILEHTLTSSFGISEDSLIEIWYSIEKEIFSYFDLLRVDNHSSYEEVFWKDVY